MMKVETKNKLGLLVEFLKEANKVFEKSGETRFDELKKRERTEIYKMFLELENKGFEIVTDYDDNLVCNYIRIIDRMSDVHVSVTFWAHSRDFSTIDTLDIYIAFHEQFYSFYNGEEEDERTLQTLERVVEQINSMLEQGDDTNIVNLTPHAVVVYDESGEKVLQEIPSSGMARVEQNSERFANVNGIPVNKTVYGKIENVPKQKEGTIYIVSLITAQAIKEQEPNRNDIYIVDEIVRNEKGQILGCKAFAQI